MQSFRRKKGKQPFNISGCSPDIQKQLRAQLGDKHFKKLLAAGAKEPGKGRIRVSAAEERTVDGIVFASKLESRVYILLRDSIGISRFSLQPEFRLQDPFDDPTGKRQRAIFYVADFLIDAPERKTWEDPLPPEAMVIDAKGQKTEIFRIKQKLFLAKYRVPLYLPKNEKEVLEIIGCHSSR
jgi:hypothetical protein